MTDILFGNNNRSVLKLLAKRSLKAQKNTIKVICTAENGDKKEYTVVVKRAAAHDGRVDEKPTTPATEPTQAATTTGAAVPGSAAPASGVPWWTLLLVGAAGLGGGIGMGYGLFAKRKGR